MFEIILIRFTTQKRLGHLGYKLDTHREVNCSINTKIFQWIQMLWYWGFIQFCLSLVFLVSGASYEALYETFFALVLYNLYNEPAWKICYLWDRFASHSWCVAAFPFASLLLLRLWFEEDMQTGLSCSNPTGLDQFWTKKNKVQCDCMIPQYLYKTRTSTSSWILIVVNGQKTIYEMNLR